MPGLKASVRTQLGSASSRRSLAEGFVPAVLYGTTAEPIHLAVQTRELQAWLKDYYARPGLFPLSVDGDGEFSVIVREIQHHPWKGFIRHIDFFAVQPERVIKLPVEVVPDEGVVVRGVRLLRRKLLLRGPAHKLPHVIRVPLSHLGEGQSILVRDLSIPDGVQILDPPGEIIAYRQ